MNKKFLILILLCFILTSPNLEAQEKGKVIEHLVWADTGAGKIILDYFSGIPPNYQEFQADAFLDFQVPASPKTDAIFIEFWGQSRHKWAVGYEPQSFNCGITFTLVSDLIPENVEVYIGHGLTNIKGITHKENGFDSLKRTWKIILRRDSMLRESGDWWEVEYISTGEPVPKEMAQDILNSLIDNGFTAELSATVKVEGIQAFYLYAFNVEVTRLTKK